MMGSGVEDTLVLDLSPTPRCGASSFSRSSPREPAPCNRSTRIGPDAAARTPLTCTSPRPQVPRFCEPVGHGLACCGARCVCGADAGRHAVPLEARREEGFACAQEVRQESGATTPTAHRLRASPPLAHHLRHTAQVKKVGKKVAKKAAKPLPKGARPVQGGAKTGAGPLGTAKSFFSFGSDGGADSAASQDNWLYQARVHTAQPTAHMHCSCFATEDPRRQPGGSPLLLGHGQSSLAYSTCPRPSVSVALACLPCRFPAL